MHVALYRHLWWQHPSWPSRNSSPWRISHLKTSVEAIIPLMTKHPPTLQRPYITKLLKSSGLLPNDLFLTRLVVESFCCPAWSPSTSMKPAHAQANLSCTSVMAPIPTLTTALPIGSTTAVSSDGHFLLTFQIEKLKEHTHVAAPQYPIIIALACRPNFQSSVRHNLCTFGHFYFSCTYGFNEPPLYLKLEHLLC